MDVGESGDWEERIICKDRIERERERRREKQKEC